MHPGLHHMHCMLNVIVDLLLTRQLFGVMPNEVVKSRMPYGMHAPCIVSWLV